MLWNKESEEKDALYIDICKYIREQFKDDKTFATMMAVHDSRSQLESNVGYKNNNNSIDCIRQGDTHLEENNWYEAMAFYNESLCYAENDSELIGLAYSKRAQCFSSLKMFDKCIIDIELAEQSNYPPDELPQLQKRKEISQTLMESGAQLKLFEPKLDFEPHKDFPEMANILEFRKDEEFGKYLVTTADIDVGEVVLFEKSFAIIPTEHYNDCCICMTAQTNLIPCKTCITSMVCLQCKDSPIHTFECEMYVKFEEQWHYVALGIRTLYIAITLFPTADDLMRFVEEVINGEDELPTSINDQRSKYRWFLRFWKGFLFNTGNEISRMALAMVTPLVHQYFVEYKDFNGFFTTERSRRFFMHLVYYHLVVSRAVSNQIDFPIILQFMNHSCIPCVNTFLVDGWVIGVAFRPIRKGEQIFKCYYDSGTTRMDFAQRQHYLQRVFEFECKCERCLCQDVPPPALVKAMRADHNFRLVRQFFDNSNGGDPKQRKALTKAVKGVLRKHYRVVWVDEMDDVNALNAFRNLLVSKYNFRMEY